MKRVLHLISQLEEGGAQRQLAYILKHARNHQMEVASLIASPPEKLFPAFRDPQAPVHYLSYSNDFYAPEIIPALRKLLKENHYDLLHCWLFEAIIQGVFVSAELSVPCIAAPRNMTGMLAYHKKWERVFLRRALPLADMIVFPSSSSAVDFLDSFRISPDRTRIVRNGVDCNVFQPPAGEGRVIVGIGRISAEKGYEDLAAAIQLLRARHPEMTCLIAGSGEDRAIAGLEFAGPVTDAAAFLQQGLVYISTSKVEGMSNALLEAQATGLPAVARRIGGNTEVIQHGVTGFLCDSVNDFVERIDQLWSDPGLRSRMGTAARKRMMSDFAVVNQVEKLEAVYCELL